MRILRFDHPIVLVDDIDAATRDFSGFGFDVYRRSDIGEYETVARFVTFGDGSCIELCAFKDPARPSEHRWWPLLPLGEGWVEYCVQCEDVDACVAALKAAGMPVGERRLSGRPLAGGRHWQAACADAGVRAGSHTMPLFFQDLTPREVRIPRPGTAQQVPAHGMGVVGITLATRSIADVEEVLTITYGAGRRIAPRVQGAGATVLFSFMGRWIELIEPVEEDGPVAEHLKRRGDGIYEVAIGWAGKDGPGTGVLLPLEKTHGARLRVSA